MEIKVFGEHLEVTDSIKEYIKKKFEHLHKPDKLMRVEFRIGSTKANQYIHFHAFFPNSDDKFIKSEDKDLYHAIDDIMNKIGRSFTKEKQIKHTHLV
jgi:putative sigma-54 modulation protein